MCISCLHIFAEARAGRPRVSNGTILLYFAKNPLILYCITRKNGETRPRGARRPGLGVIKGIGGRIRRYTRAQRRRRESVRAGAGCVSSVRASACQAGGGKAREFNGDEIRKLRRHDLLNCELVPSRRGLGRSASSGFTHPIAPRELHSSPHSRFQPSNYSYACCFLANRGPIACWCSLYM